MMRPHLVCLDISNLIRSLLFNLAHLHFTFEHIRINNGFRWLKNLDLVVFGSGNDDPTIMRIPVEVGDAVREATVHEQACISVS